MAQRRSLALGGALLLAMSPAIARDGIGGLLEIVMAAVVPVGLVTGFVTGFRRIHFSLGLLIGATLGVISLWIVARHYLHQKWDLIQAVWAFGMLGGVFFGAAFLLAWWIGKPVRKPPDAEPD